VQASGGEDGVVQFWDARRFARQRTLRPDRRSERMDITGLTGVTPAQRVALLALGAVEHQPASDSLRTPDESSTEADRLRLGPR
jgi:hypothetical protein